MLDAAKSDMTHSDVLDDEVPEEVIMEETYFQEYVEELEKVHNTEESREKSFDDDDDYDNLFANILNGRETDGAAHDSMDCSNG